MTKYYYCFKEYDRGGYKFNRGTLYPSKKYICGTNPFDEIDIIRDEYSNEWLLIGKHKSDFFAEVVWIYEKQN